jgi:hypothetical protein
MQNAFAKLAFSIANRNSAVNQLSDAEMLKSSLGLAAGTAGLGRIGYDLYKAIR